MQNSTTQGLAVKDTAVRDSPAIKDGPLRTPWTDQVRPDNALVEYPRPQFVRQQWQNLNGSWDYLGQDGLATAPPEKSSYQEKILVPYPPESALSGIGRHNDVMWYRKVVQVSPQWFQAGFHDGVQGKTEQEWLKDHRILLHFGAVDQTATVWVNGQQVATHTGGFTEFSVDITAALKTSDSTSAGQDQEIIVQAEDRSELNPFPVGKQRSNPGGIFYTGSSGIWQTVWLEPVSTTHLEKVAITSSLKSFSITPTISELDPAKQSAYRMEVVASGSDNVEVARVIGEVGKPVDVVIPTPHLWTPEDPWLYNLALRLFDSEGQLVDEVKSYAGLRTVSTVRDSQGRPRIALNNKITFLHGPLDQGFWPDGLYTAPTDEALRFDLEKTKELGFNFVRKHIKVEPARWYYWADKLGLLVWQDMPSLNISFDVPSGPKPDPTDAEKENYRSELVSIVDQLRNVTSIIGWVPFNEGWGEFDAALVARSVKNKDRTRLVIAASGVNCCFSRPDSGAGDVYDDHTYVGPGRPNIRDARSTVDGEYGGLGLVVADHIWPGKPRAYEMTADPGQLTRRYLEISEDLERVIKDKGLSGAIYTQTTDVENEVNGFFTYDRKVEKMDFSAVAKRNRAVIAAGSR